MSSVVMKSGEVPRYNAGERVTHWVVAITFILLAVKDPAIQVALLVWMIQLIA